MHSKALAIALYAARRRHHSGEAPVVKLPPRLLLFILSGSLSRSTYRGWPLRSLAAARPFR